jgi:hypothetical protein
MLAYSTRRQSYGREGVGLKFRTSPGKKNTRKRHIFYFILFLGASFSCCCAPAATDPKVDIYIMRSTLLRCPRLAACRHVCISHKQSRTTAHCYDGAPFGRRVHHVAAYVHGLIFYSYGGDPHTPGVSSCHWYPALGLPLSPHHSSTTFIEYSLNVL